MPRVSIRQLMLLVALVAVAMVSLRYATLAWQGAVVVATLIVVVAMLIVAIVERGRRQAFAIGFLIAFGGYAGLAIYEPYPPYRGDHLLPVDSLLQRLWGSIHYELWIESNTGKVLGKYVEGQPPPTVGITPGNEANHVQLPEFYWLHRIGHSWCALLAGYVGGLFARYIYLRRTKEHAASSTKA